MHLSALLVILALSCAGCTGSRNYHVLQEGTVADTPRYIELRRDTRVATLHFPAGIYQLEAADDAGFFYRAPAQIREDSSGGRYFHNGGLYLSKSRLVLRGYVYWYNGLTHVGNLSRADYILRD